MDRTPLFAGISEVSVPSEVFELGHGVRLSSARAHLMRPFLMTHQEPDSSFPAFMSASGSYGLDIVAQIELPADFETSEWFDPANSIWWFAALLRLRSTSQLRVPVLSDQSFQSFASKSGQRFWPVEPEADRARLLLDPEAPTTLGTDTLSWVRDHWFLAGQLMRSSAEFNTLFQAFDQSTKIQDLALSLLLMWSALESMFSPSHSELRFRVSANIACFLEPPGGKRAELQRSCAKLYDTRSAAAHGRRVLESKPVIDTYALLKRVLEKIVERNEVPTPASLENALLNGT